MQYDFSRVLVDADGAPASEDGKPATVLLGLKRALLADKPNLSADAKLKRYELFLKLSTQAPPEVPVELTVDEVSLLKDAADIFPTLVYGQLVAFLNQK